VVLSESSGAYYGYTRLRHRWITDDCGAGNPA
jgi:hypothetical protein